MALGQTYWPDWLLIVLHTGLYKNKYQHRELQTVFCCFALFGAHQCSVLCNWYCSCKTIKSCQSSCAKMKDERRERTPIIESTLWGIALVGVGSELLRMRFVACTILWEHVVVHITWCQKASKHRCQNVKEGKNTWTGCKTNPIFCTLTNVSLSIY